MKSVTTLDYRWHQRVRRVIFVIPVALTLAAFVITFSLCFGLKAGIRLTDRIR